MKTSSDYFNTLAVNEKEPTLIKAIIDENIKAMDGSRVRLRLLDDVEIGEMVVKKGAYLYAIMSGFSSQRVKGTVKSVLVDDEIVKSTCHSMTQTAWKACMCQAASSVRPPRMWQAEP